MPNRLADETSPYLLQHRDNPVDWYPWGEEALDRAKREDLPILISVGYSACHWCHVMERESFEDPETAAYMNENFVCIKVDREERPDIDALYMEAVQTITGHGGWPMTVFCDSDAVPFHGGTYFPPEPTGNLPSFRMVMEAVVATYRTRRDEIRGRSGPMAERLGAIGRIRVSPDHRLDPSLLEAAEQAMMRRADHINGGFGGAPKFPPASALEFLLGRGRADFAAFTLDRMLAGGIYDQVGGGFARYSVDAVWHVPHFEKMLYDNALLARLCLHVWQELGHERHRRACVETLEWALREMRSPEGGFYSALDADSEGEEGRFYVWTREEFAETLAAAGLDADEIAAAERHFGVTEHGNFEGAANVLHLPEGVADERPEPIERARVALYERREGRVRPGLDIKCLTAWNALMITALAEAGAVLGRPEYIEAARDCAALILDRMRDESGRLLRSLTDGRARFNAYLEDHAYLVEALIVLYEATFERRWLEEAAILADHMIDRFGDREGGGFFTTSEDHERLIARRKDLGDHPSPSGNSSAALGLLRLAGLTGEDRYRRAAEETVKLFAATAVEHADSFGHLLQALALALDGGRELAILFPGPATDDSPGSRDFSQSDGETPAGSRKRDRDALARTLSDPLVEVSWRRYRPDLVRAAGFEGEEFPALLRNRATLEGRPTAFLCRNFSCRLPVTDARDLLLELDGE